MSTLGRRPGEQPERRVHGGPAAPARVPAGMTPWWEQDEEAAIMAAKDECAEPDAVMAGRVGISPGQDARMAGGKLGSVLRWFFSGVWLIYLIQPVAELFGAKHPHSALYRGSAVALVVVFSLLYVFLISTWWQNRVRGRIGLAALAGLAVTFSLVYGKDWTSIFIYVSAAAGFIIWDHRRALVAVAACTVGYVVLSEIVHTKSGDLWAELLPVALIGFAMIGFKMQIVLNIQLRQARGEVAKLAASEERLRLARDMHDLTGQSLSLITLKSELAVKRLSRLPASPEVDAVAAELADIGRVSRQTLHDIREAVSGYRRPTLAVEIITARTSLEAADIALDDDPALMTRSGTFDPEAEAALAWCLREATTNVVRHSGAAHCRVRLSEHRYELALEVTDDGRGLPGAGTGAEANGSGLHNMSERLSAVGGRFSAGPGRDGHGFRLVATVPLTADEPAGPGGPGGTTPITPPATALGASVRS
jgi:two-component system sensor histidine kinase DesK